MNDNINHPAHYTSGKIETIDYIADKLTPEEYRGFLKGNVIKYLSRERLKGGVEDLKKARWYLDRLIAFDENPDTQKLIIKQRRREARETMRTHGIPIQDEEEKT